MKNIKSIAHPPRTCCKHSRPLSHYMQKEQDAPALEATQHYRPAQPPRCNILEKDKDKNWENWSATWIEKLVGYWYNGQMNKSGYSYNLMLKKTPYHIISEQKVHLFQRHIPILIPTGSYPPPPPRGWPKSLLVLHHSADYIFCSAHSRLVRKIQFRWKICQGRDQYCTDHLQEPSLVYSYEPRHEKTCLRSLRPG